MPLLEVRGITKRFGGLTAVSRLSLSVEAGEIVGLIGPNGAGKTTVFNIIMGACAPNRGRVLFGEKEITGRHPHTIVSHGLVRSFQKTTLFSEMTVLENIALGFHLTSKPRFWKSLFRVRSAASSEKRLLEKAVEIAEFIGLKGHQDQKARNLSHGHQRMLGVAIALSTRPKMMLMDEPVTGMNAEEKDALMGKIREICRRGITILLVEHDMRLVMNLCDRLCVLNFGSKIAEGSPFEICRNREVIAAYLGSEYAAVG